MLLWNQFLPEVHLEHCWSWIVLRGLLIPFLPEPELFLLVLPPGSTVVYIILMSIWLLINLLPIMFALSAYIRTVYSIHSIKVICIDETMSCLALATSTKGWDVQRAVPEIPVLRTFLATVGIPDMATTLLPTFCFLVGLLPIANLSSSFSSFPFLSLVYLWHPVQFSVWDP